ncbi:MAG: DNA polymerase III subunit delta' [Isosphaeraceae bacterium]|nr:DNA polymerase III subunit delta' [Isosphaeraceae bacterium]
MSWQSIRGHDAVVESLRTSLALGRPAHAYLFVGPEGVGKRTFARAFARALLCQRVSEADFDPCGACPSCLQAAAGTHPDIHEVGKPEDKHELPISVIRDLCLELGLKPASGKRKAAIIDDADDLNDEAANAFLKTLEEPPPGSVLILIGTSAELQLDTIVSRCRVVRFEPLPDAELAQVLIEQGIVTNPESASRLARLSEGSVARARGLADAALETFRRDLIDEIASARGFDAPALARRLESFIKDAGKESAAQRTRARLIFGELARFFRGVLWSTAGLAPPSPDPGDRRAATALASRMEPEDVFILAERCLEADRHVQRRVYMPLIVDGLMHDLGRRISESSSRAERR